MRKRFVVSIGVLVAFLAAGAGAGAAPALAAAPHAGDGLPNVDLRAAQQAPVAAETRAARERLADDLGPLGEVVADAKSGRVASVLRPDALLAEASDDAPREVVLDYLRAHGDAFGLGKQDVANLRLVARSVSPDGIVHLRFNQVLDGILAFDSGIDGHVTADGRLVACRARPSPAPACPRPRRRPA